MANVNPIQLQKFLGGVDYPASKDDLLKKAEEHGADDEVMEALRALPDQEYDAPTAVTKAASS
jgi:hypothetical protein